MSTELFDLLLPCVLVVALYGAGLITGVIIARSDMSFTEARRDVAL